MSRIYTSASTSRLTWPHLPALDGVVQCVIALRVYPTTSSNYDTFLCQEGANGTGAGSTSGIALLHNAADAASLFVAPRNNDSSVFIRYTSVFNVNAWNSLVVAFDGTAGTDATRLRVFIPTGELNAIELVGTIPTSLGTCDQSLVLGAFSDATLPWSGRLADVGIWTGCTWNELDRLAYFQGVPGNQIQRRNAVFYDAQDNAPVNLYGVGATNTATLLGDQPFLRSLPRPPRRVGPPNAAPPATGNPWYAYARMRG